MVGWVTLGVGIVVTTAAVLSGRRAVRVWARRAGRRTVLRTRARIDRFKLTGRKPLVMAALLDDPAVADAVRRHAVEHHLRKEEVWRRVEEYVDEIVPFFNVLLYYNLGYRVARWLLQLFYDVTVGYARPEAMRGGGGGAPRDAVVVYLMNHRSNADYLLAGYALSGRVAISYAVGEWARVFPLEYVFKSFGSYFIRRRYREPLYHTVLERYVQLITRHGVTQGIFPEGGLTRDGRLQPAKIGLLDYILGVGRDPDFRRRLHVVPVAINYDRVLEDRSLLRELDRRQGGTPPPKLRQLGEVVHYAFWNLARLAGRRWQRYGRAAVLIGEPIPLAPWFAELEQAGVDLYALPKPERLARVQALCDGVMSRIGALIPVTPVPLVCAALQSLDRDFVPRGELLRRIEELRDVLAELNSTGLGSADATAEVGEIFERAYRLLRMRRVIARQGEGFLLLPRGRELVSYYANSIAHLLGPYEAAVRARDALPADVASAPGPRELAAGAR
jgi:glycerol-3-phosphate O-acyltransferase